MTTDPFIEAAHTEAKRMFWDGVTRAHDMAMKEARGGFIAGARWARDHLAAQEPTDAEIEAAAGAMYRNPEGWASMLALYRSMVSEGNPRAKGHVIEHRLDLAREGLRSARAARRDRRQR